MPIETTVDLIKQVCRGIALAHREIPPIIHRDIKPQNILVGYEADGLRARVSDFGLAKKVNPLTLLATAAGTLCFKPPEVFSQQRSDSCAGDVWAIGTTLYLLLTDNLPYSLPHDATWDAPGLFEGSFLPPSEINPEANNAMDRIVQRALEKRPDHRYPTASEFLTALEHWKPDVAEPSNASHGFSSSASKIALGLQSPPNEQGAQSLVHRALQKREAGSLAEAADLMEEAFNKSPDLRQKYSHQVRLWRCGISM